MLKDKTPTYISLFSSAGVGCYGFKQAGFECIATNEIVKRRLFIQKYNHKCKFDTGYICDDIKKESTKEKIYEEIRRWNKLGNDRVDVVIATPPCQGMSVANHKKNKSDIARNSLVVESIKIIKDIKPRFFILENVAAFLKTGCSVDNVNIEPIGSVIDKELGKDYDIKSRIINFKDYGSNSSRTRTLVIGCSKLDEPTIMPVELLPEQSKPNNIQEVIGHLPGLKWGEISDIDFYHSFRTYPERMRSWIHDLKQGESAFDNLDINKIPHRVINGQVVLNKNKNSGKYTRQRWEDIAPCIHTRNDQLASQNTIHPSEDRVFSIRELMLFMTIPNEFRWVGYSLEQLNKLTDNEKRVILKKEEINIRQSIGEAVPTIIFFQIAKKIRNLISKKLITENQIDEVIEKHGLEDNINLINFIKSNKCKFRLESLFRISELANQKRTKNAAYYTNKWITFSLFDELPDFNKDIIRILEPSVGVGNFLPVLIDKYRGYSSVIIDVFDIDGLSLNICKELISIIGVPDNIKINFVKTNSLTYKFGKHYDLVVGNPPFSKITKDQAKDYLINNINQDTTNLFEFFLELAVRLGDYVVMITPKNLLNSPEFKATRDYLRHKNIYSIYDFGEKGFPGVLIETICICISNLNNASLTKIKSIPNGHVNVVKQDYITDDLYPYWIIYRNSFFDKMTKKMKFNVFDVYRDRQITKSNTIKFNNENSYRVLKSRNISDDGTTIIDVPGYDTYIDKEIAKTLSIYKFAKDNSTYLAPNMTYKPRVMRNNGSYMVNGSVAILVPKDNIDITNEQLNYFSSEEYRQFYRIARNYQTRSLNIDSSSVFFYGLLKEKV